MIVADTSGLLALFDASEAQHGSVRALVEQERDALAVSPYVIAELDYLIGSRWGVEREVQALEELAGGAWELATIDAVDLARGTRRGRCSRSTTATLMCCDR